MPAITSCSIRKSEVVAYEELGAEAVRCLDVDDFPVTMVNDISGCDIYQEGKARYLVKPSSVSGFGMVSPEPLPQARARS